jgi:WD40 repeat protein
MRLTRNSCATGLLLFSCLLLLQTQNVQGQSTAKYQPLIIPQAEHAAHFSSVPFSSNVRRVLTEGADEFRPLQTASGREMGRLEATFPVTDSPNKQDDRGLSADHQSNNDDRGSGSRQPRLVVQLGDWGEIGALAISPNGRLLATAGREDLSARLWDIKTLLQVQEFVGHTLPVTSIAFSPNGQRLLTGSLDCTARLWDIITGKPIDPPFEGHREPVMAVAFSPDGQHIVTGSSDATARLWDIKKHHELEVFAGHKEIVTSVALSPNGRWLLTGDRAGARIWKVAPKQPIHQLVHRSWGYGRDVWSVAFSPDSRFALTGGRDHSARMWNVDTGKEVRRFCPHTNSVNSIAFSPDGEWVITATPSDGVQSWKVSNHNEVRYLGLGIEAEDANEVRYLGPGETEAAWPFTTKVAISTDGRWLFEGKKGVTRRWDIQAGKIDTFEGYGSPIESVAFSPDGRSLLLGSADGTARWWNLVTGQETHRLVVRDRELLSEVRAVAFSDDGHTVMTSDIGGSLLWNVPLDRASGHIDSPTVISTALSKDGSLLLISSADGNVRLWNWANKQELHQISKPRPGFPIAVAFHNARQVLIGNDDGSVGIWNLEKKELVCSLRGLTKPVTSVAFSPNGDKAAGGGVDGIIMVWNVSTCEQVGTPFKGHLKQVRSIAFSPNGQKLLTGGDDSTARLWDVASRKEIKVLSGHQGPVTAVAFSPHSDRLIATGSHDRTARLWDAESGYELARLFSYGRSQAAWRAIGTIAVGGSWVAVTPDGRFDADNLEEIRGLHWIMPDDPLRPLPVEIFMRDYYEPQLLPRVLKGEKFKPIRPLADLNRVQPGVMILKVEQGASPDIAKVIVEVSRAQGTIQRDAKEVLTETGVHDLRLYRNGQLVGQWPEAGEVTYKSLNTTSEEELRAWRKATEITLDKNGKATKTFTVRLPRREDLKEVQLTAYAFNLDRVKSETARPPQPYKVPPGLKSLKGRAYVTTVGVSGNEDMAWRLSFASEDAKLIQRTVGKKLNDSGRYEKVVPICLITTPPGSGDPEAQEVCRELIQPTKENIKTVLDILAGREVDPARLEQIPQVLRSELRRVRPEDLVLLSFSSHGVMDANGEFYLLPYDLGMDSAGRVTPELLKRSISSQELSLWLAPVDAEQLMMVVDACHSAAAVEAEGFKPGPMGNPGLGQLSYDKGMPILVASQASESAGALRYSLLTQALAQEGIEEKQLGLTEALRYAEQRVPKLSEEKLGKEATKKIQEPKLFEFKRHQ